MSIYGLLIAVGIAVATEWLLRKEKIFNYRDILLILVLSLIGARALFLLHNIEEVRDGSIEILALWNGGLAFFGALLGLLLAVYILSKSKNTSFLLLTDKLLVFLPLIQSIGRLGNYFNNELYGKPTDLFWSIYIPLEKRLSGYESYTHFHPVFIYESVLNLLLFISLLLFTAKRRYTGLTTGIYFIGYSLIRIFTNTLRIDKEYVLGIETSDLFSYIFLLIGLTLILFSLTKKHTS